MKRNRKPSEREVLSAVFHTLKDEGLLLPRDDEDMLSLEDEYGAFPKGEMTPEAALEIAHAQKSSPEASADSETDELEGLVLEDLSLAARKGNNIAPEVWEKMVFDRSVARQGVYPVAEDTPGDKVPLKVPTKAQESHRKSVVAPNRRAYLIRIAEELADAFVREEAKTDPILIIREHGLSWSFGDYGDYFDGMLHHEGGRFHIYCNLHRCREPDSPRARFTLCHELGHFFIPEHHRALRSGQAPSHPSFCNEPQPDSYVEAEADLFASRLLMPDRGFMSAICKRGTTLEGVRAIANDLGASLQATLIRFEDSESVPCAFVWWRSDGKPWYGVSRCLRIHGFRLRIPDRESVAPGSPTHYALQAAGNVGPGVFSSDTLASVWFRNIPQGSERDVIVREESIVTTYGILTWLSARADVVGSLPSVFHD